MHFFGLGIECDSGCQYKREVHVFRIPFSFHSFAGNVKVACENMNMSLSCPAGTIIHITTSRFWRSRMDVCTNSNKSMTLCKGNDTDWTQMVREACQGRQSCVLQATAGNASEPCPRVSKYLVLNYECKPSKLTNLHCLGLHAEDISYLHVLISGLIHAAMEQINFP